MPEAKTLARVRRDQRQGKSAATQAGEFVREEMHHIRAGKHGARSARQAIAIGLSKARRAGIRLSPPKPGKTSDQTRRKALRDALKGQDKAASRPSVRRSRATTAALKREGKAAASKPALSRQARVAAGKRSAASRSAAAKKASATKGKAGRSVAARKAARTRSRAEGRARHPTRRTNRR